MFNTTTPTWLILLMAFVPVLVWLGMFWYRDYEREPVQLMKWTFVFGMLSTVPILAYRWSAGAHPNIDILQQFQQLMDRTWLAYALFFLVVALVEEYVKHVAMIFTVERNRKEFTQIIDGVVYGVAAAMGFAFIENAMYLGESARNLLVLVFISRALGATFGHAIFSGVFGLFYGQATFTRAIIQKSRNPLRVFNGSLFLGMGFHIVRTHLIPHRGIMEKPHTSGQLLAEGYWLAVMLHLFYDLLAASMAFYTRDVSWLIAPLLMLAGGWLLYQFAVPENQAQRKRMANIMTFPEWLMPTKRSRNIRKNMGLSEGL